MTAKSDLAEFRNHLSFLWLSNEEEPIKNEGTRVITTLFNFSDAQG